MIYYDWITYVHHVHIAYKWSIMIGLLVFTMFICRLCPSLPPQASLHTHNNDHPPPLSYGLYTHLLLYVSTCMIIGQWIIMYSHLHFLSMIMVIGCTYTLPFDGVDNEDGRWWIGNLFDWLNIDTSWVMNPWTYILSFDGHTHTLSFDGE